MSKDLRDRIAKLERLAGNNSNPHEAAAAQAKADQLRARLGPDPEPSRPGTFTTGNPFQKSGVGFGDFAEAMARTTQQMSQFQQRMDELLRQQMKARQEAEAERNAPTEQEAKLSRLRQLAFKAQDTHTWLQAEALIEKWRRGGNLLPAEDWALVDSHLARLDTGSAI